MEEALDRFYGPVQPARRAEPLDELVGTILSQNTSDLNSGRAFDSLLARFGSWEAVAGADEAEIIDAIRLGGLAQIKGPRIKRVLQRIKQDRGELSLEFLCDLPPAAARAYLTALPGVGLKTAACVQLFACGQDALPVDTHVHRVATRLGLVPIGTSADRAHDVLEAIVPPARHYSVHVHLIRHGREICKAQRPRCTECPLRDLCPRVGVSVDGTIISGGSEPAPKSARRLTLHGRVREEP